MSNYNILQRTISKTVSFSGTGLHSGGICNITLKPSEADTGIIFIRKDLKENNVIPADFRYIYKSNLCTTLKAYNSDAKILTVEHLLASIKGNSIDNLIIEVDSQEIPILDGSARDFDDIIKSVGTTEHINKFKKYLFINKKVIVKNENSVFTLEPFNELKINCTVNFPEPIGKQTVTIGNNYEDIYKEVMDAKTFCFFEDIEIMQKNGLARGGNLDNAIVIKDGKVINSDFDNSNNYFAKHKILDVVGDLSLMGLNLIGNISVYYPGHEINRLVMNEIFSDYSNFRIYQHNKNDNIISTESALTA